MTYVFGPVLKLLKAKGYTEGVDLDAAPYDWRSVPNVLESRDGYFSNTMDAVECLYRNSGNTPVVLLCHSMGCKVGHYLLNFVLHRLGQTDGEAWIERHIHCYVPVGAPHIGAQKPIRGLVTGDKMGLDAFLDDGEGLMLGRSLGSAMWLLPNDSLSEGGKQSATLPQPPPVPAVVLRREATIRIDIPPQILCLTSLVHNRKRLPPTKLRLAISIGDNLIVRTDFAKVRKGGPGFSSLQVDVTGGTWCIACPPTLEETLRKFPYLQLHIEEPGTGEIPNKKEGNPSEGQIWGPLYWVSRRRQCNIAVKITVCQLILLCDPTLGETRVMGHSHRIDWKNGLIESRSGNSLMYQICTQFTSTEDVRYGFMLRIPTPESFTFNVKWEPGISTPQISANICHQFTDKNEKISYSPCSMDQLFRSEGLTNAINLMSETYGKDPVVTVSAWDPPPVKKVVAIYGYNLPTEVAAVYRRNPVVRVRTLKPETRHALNQLYVLDNEAILSEKGSATHVMEGGVIYETEATPQNIIGSGVTERKSGDGTVPYWSLQHCRKWQNQCDLSVHEIKGAEHRAILNDDRFHNILCDICLH
ncbi:hypothetical protein ACHAWF_006693 [Thalassiosira exigua]